MKIQCVTLFDITRSGINTRRQEHGIVDEQYQKKRNQQSNFETVLQLVSMRGQPENITDPEKIMAVPTKSNFGKLYETKSKIPTWTFFFEINQQDVFTDEDGELGKLAKDCVGIPIITGLDEWSKLGKILDMTDEYRNIYFRVINDGQNDQ